MALLATVVFCAAFLFFYREGNIFGVQYIKQNQILYATEDEDMTNLETIVVNSDVFDVYIRVNPSVNSLTGAMKSKVFGYTTKTKAHTSFSLEYNEKTKTAVFDSVEPKGWLNKKDSFIEIAIPESMAEKGYDIQVNTNKGKTLIGGDNDWTIGALNINTNKGKVTVTNITLNDNINVNIGSGWILLDDKCKTNTTVNATVNLGSGTVNFARVNTEIFKFNAIKVESLKSGRIGITKAEELITDGNINGGGSVEVTKEIKTVKFSSLDTDVKINTIKDVSQIEQSEIVITGQGKVSVNESLCCHLTIDGHNGDIKVNSATGTMTLLSNQGDVNVSKALKLVSATTQYGNIYIEFDSEALDYFDTPLNDSNKNRVVSATTKNGHIIVKGLQHGAISATGNGRISLEYDRIVGENNINGKSGAVNIRVPNPSSNEDVNDSLYAFNLSVYSEVLTDVKVGVVGSLGSPEYDINSSASSQNFTNIYGTAGANKLTVTSTTGKIKIRSNDLVAY